MLPADIEIYQLDFGWVEVDVQVNPAVLNGFSRMLSGSLRWGRPGWMMASGCRNAWRHEQPVEHVLTYSDCRRRLAGDRSRI